MILIEKLRYLGNSPTHERDVATMFNVFRLGVWFFFLNAVLLSAIGGTFMLLSEISASPDFENALFESLGLSDILTSVIFLSMSAFLTIFVPIRVVGPIMGPRMGRYFDQIVLSGISPVRYFVGKVMSQNVFLCVIAVAALPYLVLCISLGGISVKYTLLGIGVLAFYTNVLAVCTLLLSVFVTEIASILITLALFAGTFCMGLMPMMPNPAPVSTSAVFMAPLYDSFYAARQAGFEVGLRMLGELPEIEMPQLQLLFFLITGGVLAAICIAYLVLGPLNCINQENSTFGEVVLKGDAKKRGFLKRRLMLRLRSEISFFYENRSPWLKRWDFVLRWGIAELLFLLGLALPFAFIPILSSAGSDDIQMVGFVFLAGLFWTLLNNLLFLKDRTVERLRHRGIEAGHADLLFYFANLVMITAAVGLFLSLAGDALDKRWIAQNVWQVAQGGAASLPPVWHLPGMAAGMSFFVIGFELHWFARCVTTRMWSKWSALTFAFLVYVGVTFFLPLGPFLSIQAADLPKTYAGLEMLFSALTNLALTTPYFYCAQDYPYRAIEFFGKLGFNLTLVFHFNAGLAWMLVYLRMRRKLPVRELT